MENDRRRGVSFGEELCFNRMISRNSSVGGCSSRIYYCRSSEGIPFNWEMQPGTPKQPQKEDDILPPISPPPALLSLGLPKPCIDIVDEPKPNPSIMKLRIFKFWKQAGKRNNRKIYQNQADKYSNYEMSSSDDGEFMASPSRISSSSSSSSFSFSNGVSVGSSSPYSRDSSLNRHYGCSPLNFSSLLVRVSRSR